mgnify:CR=1 FL=1
MNNGRQVAVQALLRVETADSYSNIVLDRLLESSRLSARDRAFSSALFYGVLEKKLTLDYVISQYSSLPFGKMDPLVRQLLRLAIYQIVYMDGVPEAAHMTEDLGGAKVYLKREDLNHTGAHKINNVLGQVLLAKKMGKGRAAGFINGVLRSFLRAGGEIRLPQPGKDRAGWLSLAYSIPRPLIKLWQNQYPKEDAEALLRGMTGHAPLFVRVNTRRIDAPGLCSRLAEEGVKAQPFPDFSDCVVLYHAGALEHLEAFRQGLFHVQDLSGQVCASALGVRPGMRVLEFAFSPTADSAYLPHNCVENCVCYAGTHDNAPLALWRQEAEPEEIDFAVQYLGLNEREGFNRGVLRGGMTSPASLFVAQMQDWLELGKGSRINTPGTGRDNWQWRLLPGELTVKLIGGIREMTRIYGRLPAKQSKT